MACRWWSPGELRASCCARRWRKGIRGSSTVIEWTILARRRPLARTLTARCGTTSTTPAPHPRQACGRPSAPVSWAAGPAHRGWARRSGSPTSQPPPTGRDGTPVAAARRPRHLGAGPSYASGKLTRPDAGRPTGTRHVPPPRTNMLPASYQPRQPDDADSAHAMAPLLAPHQGIRRNQPARYGEARAGHVDFARLERPT